MINVELIPCDAKGKELTDKDTTVVQNPQTELLNKNISFLIKINGTRNLNQIYEVKIKKNVILKNILK